MYQIVCVVVTENLQLSPRDCKVFARLLQKAVGFPKGCCLPVANVEHRPSRQARPKPLCVAHRNGRNPSASENAGRGEKIAQWAIFEGKPTSGVSPVKLPFRFRFSRWENGGKIQQERSRAPFFLQKGPSCQTFPRNVWQFTPRKCAFQDESSALCGERPKGRRPFGFPATFYKRWTKILCSRGSKYKF